MSYYHPIYLKAWREYKGIGVEELAAWSGVSRATIFWAEQRHRRWRPDTLGLVAKTLGITREQLLNEPPPGGERITDAG